MDGLRSGRAGRPRCSDQERPDSVCRRSQRVPNTYESKAAAVSKYHYDNNDGALYDMSTEEEGAVVGTEAVTEAAVAA